MYLEQKRLLCGYTTTNLGVLEKLHRTIIYYYELSWITLAIILLHLLLFLVFPMNSNAFPSPCDEGR